MKHIKLYEEFVNESRKTFKGRLVSDLYREVKGRTDVVVIAKGKTYNLNDVEELNRFLDDDMINLDDENGMTKRISISSIDSIEK
jgi:hypothetical protein